MKQKASQNETIQTKFKHLEIDCLEMWVTEGYLLNCYSNAKSILCASVWLDTKIEKINGLWLSEEPFDKNFDDGA